MRKRISLFIALAMLAIPASAQRDRGDRGGNRGNENRRLPQASERRAPQQQNRPQASERRAPERNQPQASQRQAPPRQQQGNRDYRPPQQQQQGNRDYRPQDNHRAPAPNVHRTPPPQDRRVMPPPPRGYNGHYDHRYPSYRYDRYGRYYNYRLYHHYPRPYYYPSYRYGYPRYCDPWYDLWCNPYLYPYPYPPVVISLPPVYTPPPVIVPQPAPAPQPEAAPQQTDVPPDVPSAAQYAVNISEHQWTVSTVEYYDMATGRRRDGGWRKEDTSEEIRIVMADENGEKTMLRVAPGHAYYAAFQELRPGSKTQFAYSTPGFHHAPPPFEDASQHLRPVSY